MLQCIFIEINVCPLSVCVYMGDYMQIGSFHVSDK